MDRSERFETPPIYLGLCGLSLNFGDWLVKESAAHFSVLSDVEFWKTYEERKTD
jgi:hypothetical protein